tara:strand:+ start:161 stop:571 length:411 start_codon:yes stop_codon:yes gene_type:complete
MNELPQYSNYYLIDCNRTRDIENNIGIVEMLEFTMDHVNIIDRNYKKHLFKVTDIEFQGESGLFDEISVRSLNNSFELNELFLEHVDYMTELRGRVNEFANISEKTNKIRMYFQEIVPIVQQDKYNLKEVLEILSL